MISQNDISSHLSGERRLHYASKRRAQRALLVAVATFTVFVLIIVPLTHIDLDKAHGLKTALIALLAAIIGTCVYIICYFKTNEALLVEEMQLKEKSNG